MELINDSIYNNVFFLGTFGVFLIGIVSGCSTCVDSAPGMPVTEYDALLRKYNAVVAENAANIDDYNKLVEEFNDLTDKHADLEKKNARDVEDYNKLVDQHNSLLEENTRLEKQVADSHKQYDDLVEMYHGALDEAENLETRVSRLKTRLDRNIKYSG